MIYVVSLYYPPVSNPPANRMNFLVQFLVGKYGADAVRVVTGRPNYPHGKLPREYRWRLFKRRSGEHGETIHHIYEIPAPFRGLYRKTLGLLSFAFSVFWYFLFRRLRRGDLVYITSGPVFPVYSLYFLSHLRRNLRYVVDIRDLWPQIVAAMGFISPRSPVYRLLEKLSLKSYRRALCNVGNAEGWVDYLARELPDKERLLICNPVDTDLFRPLPAGETAAFRAQHPELFDDPGRVTFIFAGNHSYNMDLITLMDALKAARAETDRFLFVFLGYGEVKPDLEAYVTAHGLEDCVVFLPFMARPELLKYLCAVDFCYSSRVKDQVYRDFIPVKMLEYLACGKFVLAAHRCRFTDTAETNGFAMVCEAGEPDAVRDSLLRLVRERERFLAGADPRPYIVEHFSVRHFQSQMESLFANLAPQARSTDLS